MYPLISVGFQFVPSLVFALGCTAEQTFAVLPAMRYPLISDITAGVLKKRDGILAVGILGTIHTSPGKKAGQFRDCDAIQLLVKNVVDAFLQIRDFLFQPSISRLAISRRNTPDLQAGSRNVALLSCHSSSGSISSIRFATSGGVNTSSLDRFARQVRTSGLYILL